MKTYQKIIISIILIIITISLTFLFYKQAKGLYNSDLLAHIAFHASGYSIVQLIYKFIIKFLGGKFRNCNIFNICRNS